MREYRLAKRTRLFHRFAAELRQQTSRHRVAALCNAMVVRFGGVDQLAGAWWEAMHAAARQNPGGRVVLNSLAATFRLMEASDANHRRPDPTSMSDQDIEREVRELLAGAR
jgi:hypothetical protein